MLEVRDICLSYEYKQVLDKVSLRFEEGKIYSLLGENGAGKSTLAGVLCGDLIPSYGNILVNNEKVSFACPKDAIEQGIFCVHQRPLLAASVSVKENLLLGAKKVDTNLLNEYLKEYLGNIKSSTLVKDISASDRFFLSLIGILLKISSFNSKASVLILDEPTALLDASQREFLFKKLREYAGLGMTVIVITHNLSEAIGKTDYIMLLKNGKVARECKAREITKEEISTILYKDRGQAEKAENGAGKSAASGKNTAAGKNNENYKSANQLLIEFENVTNKPVNKSCIFNVNFKARGGAVTLISGPKESGLEALEDAITGMGGKNASGFIKISKPGEKGPIRINIKKEKNLRKKMNCGIIPSDRTFRGSSPELSILQLLSVYDTKGSRTELTDKVTGMTEKAEVNIRVNEKAGYLSGGMLQRLLLERETGVNPEVLVLCEPVQGLDFEACERTFKLVRKCGEEGKAVIVISSVDFPEKYADFWYVMENGECSPVRALE